MEIIMTDLLFDAPYNTYDREVCPPRLKHFYFVIPSFNSDEETVEDEVYILKTLQAAMPQWGIIHIISRDAMYGASQPTYPEEYVVTYFTLDEEGNRVPLTTGYSEFTFDSVVYADVSA
jgi:hypothetical protein